MVERHVREGGAVHDVFLASGGSYPDALAAGAAAGVRNAALVLVPPMSLGSGATDDLLSRRADQFVRLTFVGGDEAVDPMVTSEVSARLEEIRTRPV